MSTGRLERVTRTGFGPLPSLRMAGALSVAFLLCTVLVVTRLTLAIDAATLPWFTWLDAYTWGHRIPRVLVLGGQFWLTGSLAVLVGAWASWRLRDWAPVVVSIAAVGGLDVVLFVLKRWSGRPAPRSGVNEVFVSGGVSYPGGHAACAVLACVWIVHLIALVHPEAPWLRRAYGAAWVLAVVVGVTTLTLGYHWLADVVGAWLLAGVFIVLARHALRWWVSAPAARRR